MKIAKIIVLVIAAAFVLIQLVPVKRDNPPGPDTFNPPPEVKKIIERSCYDCHSNKSVWPWYAYVAPVSWTVADDVNKARKRMNLSDWASMPAKRQQANMQKMSDEIEEGGMPLPKYLIIHKNARLTGQEKQTVYKWARSGGL